MRRDVWMRAGSDERGAALGREDWLWCDHLKASEKEKKERKEEDVEKAGRWLVLVLVV